MLGESPPSLSPLYLPSDISAIFNTWLNLPQLLPPSHPLQIQTILDIAEHIPPTPRPSPFRHNIAPPDVDANAGFNSSIITDFEFNLQKLINAHPSSIISPGFEFRDAAILAPLLSGHPHWKRLHHILTQGVSYPLKAEEFEQACQQENKAILAYGNHALGKKNPTALANVIQKDAKKGYSLPITFDCAKRIRHGRISPMGVAHQMGINE